MEIAIFAGAALVVGVSIQLVRAWLARRNGTPTGVHDELIKQAEAYAERSPFLKTVCKQYRMNGHISERQVDAITSAIARLEAKR
jgi:hypothetical protein